MTNTSTNPNRLLISLIAGAFVILGIGGYVVGRHHPAVTVRHGHALSAQGGISVGEHGMGTFSIPLDVTWIDSTGSYHSDGRPECLPPVGLGEIAVTFATVKIKDPSGSRRDQTIWVDCTGWDPTQDLTPKQAAILETETQSATE